MKSINAFLCFRQQRVDLNGIKSDWSLVVSCVPQGTVLGPLLFSLHISGINSDIGSEISLFAIVKSRIRRIHGNFRKMSIV